MYSRTHLVFLPGSVSVDVVESLEMAISKIRPKRLSKSSVPARLEPSNIASSASRGLRKTVAATTHPLQKLGNYIESTIIESRSQKDARIKRELIDAGISMYGLLKSETRVLPKLLHPNEHVEAIVYGQHHANSVMLVATDERMIYLDKKPMALFLDEVSYEVISGLEFELHTFFATLVLHTPVKNYDIHYANIRCAEKFARHIEAHRLRRENPEKEPDVVKADAPEPKTSETAGEIMDDMAGYSWLPTEEEERRKIQEGLI